MFTQSPHRPLYPFLSQELGVGMVNKELATPATQAAIANFVLEAHRNIPISEERVLIETSIQQSVARAASRHMLSARKAPDARNVFPAILSDEDGYQQSLEDHWLDLKDAVSCFFL
jgi:hypothetical protein